MNDFWPLAKNFSNYIRPSLTLKELRTLREFYMAQQALARELQEAKPLGICKTTTSVGQDTGKADALVKSGISPDEDSKETWS